MNILHIVCNTNNIPKAIGQHDTIVLIGDAVYILLQQTNFRGYVMQNELIARGLKTVPNAIDYKQLINLIVQHQKTITWT